MNKKDYLDGGELQEQHTRRIRKYHFLFGLRTFVDFPILFFLFVPIVLLGVFFWTSPVIFAEDMSEFGNMCWFYFTKAFSVLIPALLSLAIIIGIGDARTHKDETHVLEAFYKDNKNELIYGSPILVKKRKNKEGIITRVFYTRIDSEILEKNERLIYQKLGEHFIEKLIIEDCPHDDGYFVKLVTAKGLFAEDKGDIIDDSFDKLIFGYDLDTWQGYGKKKPLEMNLSGTVAASTLVVGMAGSGKSESIKCLLARLGIQKDCVIYFGDFKQDDTFSFLRDCP